MSESDSASQPSSGQREAFWAALNRESQQRRGPLFVKFTNEVLNYYFAVTPMPAGHNDCPRYVVERYTPRSVESAAAEREISNTEHTYSFLSNFNLLINRLFREGYAFELL